MGEERYVCRARMGFKVVKALAARSAAFLYGGGL